MTSLQVLRGSKNFLSNPDFVHLPSFLTRYRLLTWDRKEARFMPMKRFLCIGATPSVFRHSFQVSCATVNIHCDFYVSYNWKNGVHRSAWSLKFAVTDGNRGVMWQCKCLFPIFLLARSHVELRNMGCPLVSFLHSNTRCFWSTSQSNKVWVSVSCIAVLLMGFIPILDSYQKNRTLIPVMNVMSVKFLDANPPKMSSVMNMSSFIFYVLRLWGRLQV